jgi:TonB family protein
MPISHGIITPHFGVALFLSLALIVIDANINTSAQQTAANPSEARNRGIQLYKQGDTKAAIQALSAAVKNNKEDGEAWYYLGLAALRGNDPRHARKALGTAIKLRPNFAPAHTALANLFLFTIKVVEAENEARRALSLDPQNAEAHYLLGEISLMKHSCGEAMEHAKASLVSAPNFAFGYLLKSQSIVCNYAEESLKPFTFDGTVFRTSAGSEGNTPEERLASIKRAAQKFSEAAENLKKFLQLDPESEDSSMWKEQLESLRVHSEPARKSDSDRTIFIGTEVTTKARVLVKPEPTYTQAAREAQIEGTVVLRAVFAADGTVSNILVVSSLPKGLTQRAIEAARKIKFTPAEINGVPVSIFMQIEYNFNLY